MQGNYLESRTIKTKKWIRQSIQGGSATINDRNIREIKRGKLCTEILNK